jgi:hypothetical protein
MTMLAGTERACRHDHRRSVQYTVGRTRDRHDGPAYPASTRTIVLMLSRTSSGMLHISALPALRGEYDEAVSGSIRNPDAATKGVVPRNALELTLQRRTDSCGNGKSRDL